MNPTVSSDALLAIILLLQVADTAMLFLLIGKSDGISKRVSNLEKWRENIGGIMK